MKIFTDFNGDVISGDMVVTYSYHKKVGDIYELFVELISGVHDMEMWKNGIEPSNLSHGDSQHGQKSSNSLRLAFNKNWMVKVATEMAYIEVSARFRHMLNHEHIRMGQGQKHAGCLESPLSHLLECSNLRSDKGRTQLPTALWFWRYDSIRLEHLSEQWQFLAIPNNPNIYL